MGGAGKESPACCRGRGTLTSATLRPAIAQPKKSRNRTDAEAQLHGPPALATIRLTSNNEVIPFAIAT